MPWRAKSAQCGQVSERYSTTFTRAAGLPIRKPPSGVATTVRDQSRTAAWRGWAGAVAAGSATAAAASRVKRSRAGISAADRRAQPGLELRPGGHFGSLAVDQEGRRALHIVLFAADARILDDLDQSAIV